MNRVSRTAAGVLLCGAALLSVAPAQAEAPSAAATAAAPVADGSGSSMQSIMCTVLRLIMLNQGPASCA